MYETRFGFTGRPFATAPSVQHYFPAQCIEHARTTIERAIERAQGPTLLIGPSGTGKTLVCRMLEDKFRSHFRVAVLANTRLATQKALLQSILFELGLPYRDMDESELRLALIDHLLDRDACPNGLVLIIDEACALPLRLLEEIRMITNLVCDGEPRVRVVLSGGDRLEEKFVSPRLDSLNQRIAARCYLGSFTRDETMGYVRAQISVVGGEPDQIFADDALVAIHRSTDGIPRLINQLCDHALIRATVEGSSTINAEQVDAAWAELQQLPTPWSGAGYPGTDDQHQTDTSNIIEFGELGDDRSTITLEVDPTAAVMEVAGEVEPEDRVDRLTKDLIQAAYAADNVEADLQDYSETDSDLTSDPPSMVPIANVEQSAPQHRIAGSDAPIEDHVVSLEQDYQHEEVVLDRYATLDATYFQQRQQVYSSESREIAAALATLWTVRLEVGTPEKIADGIFPVQPTGDAVNANAPANPHPGDGSANTGLDPSASSASEWPAEDAPEIRRPEVNSIGAQIDEMQDIVSQTVKWEPIDPIDLSGGDDAHLPDDDRDLILVEDAGEEGPIRKPVRATPRKPKRGQYRQLFAKLRRG